MGGSVAIHALHVSGARDLSENQDWLAAESGSGAPGSVIAPTGAFGLRSRARSEEASTDEATLRALEKIVDRLQEMNSENKDLQRQNSALQDQLKETNRDLIELQFRVDSHSQEFRPMPVSASWCSASSRRPHGRPKRSCP